MAVTKQLDATPSDAWAVFLTFPALYVVSSILFIFAFLLMRIVIKLKVKNEELSLNRTDKKTQSGSDSDA